MKTASTLALVLMACGGGTPGHAYATATGSASSGGGATAGGAATDAGATASGTNATATGDAGSPAPSGVGFIAPTGPQAQRAAQLFNDGSRAYAQGDFPTAARVFRQAYDLVPAPEMAYNLARVYERMGEVSDAVHFFDIVRGSHPDATQLADIDRRVTALRAYAQRRRDGVAQTMPSTDALSAEGNQWFARGVTLYRRGQYAQALIAFEQAYNYLQTPELFFNLAVTHEHLHHFDRAIEFMREYLQARAGTPEEAYIQRRIQQLEAQR